MSRISLPVRPGATYEGKPVREFIVGLDRPLQHWFYQVWGPEPEDEDADHGPLNFNALEGCPRGTLLDMILDLAEPGHSLTLVVAREIALDIDPGPAANQHAAQHTQPETLDALLKGLLNA